MGGKVIEYAMAQERDEIEFLKRINGMLLNGWQPYGSIMQDDDYTFIQPMVKLEKPYIQGDKISPKVGG